MLKLMAGFSVNCPFLFPNFAPTWWKKIGSQAATSSSMGTLAIILQRHMGKIEIIFFELLGWHILITFFSIVFLSGIINIGLDSQISFFVSFIFILFLYSLSGFFLTKKLYKWYNYFSIAFIGIVLWIICYVKSSENTNYKQNSDAGLWFINELYIMASSPLNFIEMPKYSLKFDLVEKFIIPIIFSMSQFIGGFTKMKRIKKRLLTHANSHG